ncbi:lysozyme C, milk isozyme-like [Leucoraja erinacea]|uniref:lysozyme C, milk isozyme-like n=1 Tax=Leucoraja erinaceus TaxID=7782 RepID=UPI00245442BD|nr:lysozyme C, milk isozyme-like [Leucoraja erinacea]XP_055501245.1 lysozyme C, milk isozyme-like [Leucoraja erinacea]
MKTLFLLCVLFTVASLRTYSKCELARVFQSYGLDDIPGYSLADWVCMVQYESSFRTNALRHNRRIGRVDSTNYGLFQFNSRWWCADGKMGNSRNGCKQHCTQFVDNNIADDITCAKRVVKDRQGMDAWYGWKKHCKGKVDNYLQECNL